jgi:hypothetical protein
MKRALSRAASAFALAAFVFDAQAASARLYSNADSAPESFAAEEIEAALHARRYTVARSASTDSAPLREDLLIRFTRSNSDGAANESEVLPEGFEISVGKDGARRAIHVFSVDAGGAMYGGLELAEQIRARGVAGVVETRRNPHMRMRGTKFNIPLDLRTPSYSDMSDAAQKNIATVWDFEFWRAYIDKLARDRYNFVSLWSLHPFPSMVKVPAYPEVALADVWRSNTRFAEDYSTRTTDIVTPAMLADKTVVKSLSIEEKIDYWRRVMQYAADRNIRFYVVTWNVFTYGVDGKYGITDDLANPKTIDYFRASVREMFRTYPLLAGIGVTAGENMGDASAYYSGGTDSFHAKENWLLATYGQGLLDAAKAEPGRQFTLIHRQHETRAQDIAASFRPVIAQPNADFVFSFKYAQAHILSSTTQTFHREFVDSLGNLQTVWTLRNDDALLLRWAAPDFVREFLRNIPMQKTRGFYLGSDMWVWGREFLSKLPGTQGQLEVEKHWLHFFLWGRLGYDPMLDDARIAQIIELRFPGTDGASVLAAWQNASLIYPLVTGFHWADFDFQWYIEACRSRPGPARTDSGFHSVETFITQKVHPGTNNLTIPQYVAGIVEGKAMPGVTPLQVADLIDARADAALAGLRVFQVKPRVNGAEFAATFNDVQLMAQLGKYYAAKIRGATELVLYRTTRDQRHQELAVKHLNAAAGYWKEYSRRIGTAYGPYWTNRVGQIDWDELGREVIHDVDIARAALP